ncbi:MAG: hypothetical protein WCO35_02395 [Candidatus Nomurabacteria bacterium]
MPNKKEIKLLRHLNKIETRYDNNKRGDLVKNVKLILEITDNDLGDLHYSKYLQFSSKLIESKEDISGWKNEPLICITHEGSLFVENYCYKKIKELFFWVFGIATFIAAIFAVIAVYKK